MIQSIVQSYDYKKKIGKGGGGEGTTVVANPTGPAQAWLDKIKIGEDIFQTKQVPRTLDEDKVLISDPDQETGTKWENPKNLHTNLDSVADEYDETKNPSNHIAYKMGDYVIYDNDLYKANQTINTKAGPFNEDMWDMATTYDTQETYALGDITVYNGDLYKCTSETGATGEWDATKWEIQYPQTYNSAASYYTVGTVVEHNGDYYQANATYENAPVGSFDVLKWTKTNVTNNLASPFKTFPLLRAGNQITTDANGFLIFTVTRSSGISTPIAIYANDNQPNTGARYELVTSSYISEGSKIIVKVTDNTGAAMTSTTLKCYMTNLLTVVYFGTGEITAVSNETIGPVS